MDNSYDPNRFLATLVVERGWVSNEDVQVALISQKSGKFFGEILHSKKQISLQQLDELLRLQQDSKIRRDDYLFGQLAVHNRLIKAQDVIICLEEQKNAIYKKKICEILKDKGLLTEQQCSQIISSQKAIQKSFQTKLKTISCPKCQTAFKVNDLERFRKVRCKSCQYIFEVGNREVEVITNSGIIDNNNTIDLTAEEKTQSLIQFLNENQISPQTNLSDAANTMFSGNERYVLGNEIARGGMGKIVLTKDVNLRRNIVTKVLLNKNSKLATLRFIEEAQITGQLEHPNIPPVYDLGLTKEKNIFFTMKQIKGETLQSIIKKLKENDDETRERYSFNALVNIFLKVCNALEFAHSKKVIHRDIKPENIMVGEYGEVLLMDWGIAKVVGVNEEFEELEGEKISSVRTEDESTNTIEGTTAGTPSFMSPEQAAGHIEKLDQRSDIYSLGATLFNAFSLEKPFKGKTVYELLNNVTKGRIQELKGKIPPELKAITLKAMEFKPENRYQSIKEMEKDFLNYQMGYSVSAKQDNIFDILKKFYKRNKLLTTVSLSFFIICLVGSILFVISLKEAINQFEKEKRERLSDNKGSAPTFYAKAQQEAQVDNFAEAEKLMDTAINYDPNNQAYLLYRGCLAFTNNNIKKALEDLKQINSHASQKSIDELITILNPPELIAIGESQKTRLSELCIELKFFDISQKLTMDLNKKIELWRKKLRETWGKNNFNLFLKDKKLHFGFNSTADNFDFSVLKGIPFQSIQLGNLSISNISFMEKMPLEELMLYNCQHITDISALKGIKLNNIYFEGLNVTDLSALANAELKKATLRRLPITSISPLLNQPIKEISFSQIKLTNFNELKSFNLEKLTINNSTLDNIDFLNIASLKELILSNSRINNLDNLKNCKLEILDLIGSGTTKLEPLQNCSIKTLNLSWCPIDNLEILTSIKNLETLAITPGSLKPNWEETIIKMKNQIKKIGIGLEPQSLKTVDKFLEEYKGVNNKNPKKK